MKGRHAAGGGGGGCWGGGGGGERSQRQQGNFARGAAGGSRSRRAPIDLFDQSYGSDNFTALTARLASRELQHYTDAEKEINTERANNPQNDIEYIPVINYRGRYLRIATIC